MSAPTFIDISPQVNEALGAIWNTAYEKGHKEGYDKALTITALRSVEGFLVTARILLERLPLMDEPHHGTEVTIIRGVLARTPLMVPQVDEASRLMEGAAVLGVYQLTERQMDRLRDVLIAGTEAAQTRVAVYDSSPR